MQACRGRSDAAAGDDDNEDNDGDDNDDDDIDDYQKMTKEEDRGVLIEVVENSTEEYHTREGDSPSLIGQGKIRLYCVAHCMQSTSRSLSLINLQLSIVFIKFFRKTLKFTQYKFNVDVEVTS